MKEFIVVTKTRKVGKVQTFFRNPFDMVGKIQKVFLVELAGQTFIEDEVIDVLGQNFI